MITRCPACSTAFNVNSQQLASARGAVRCGSCLQVFKATDHVVFDGLQDTGSQADHEAESTEAFHTQETELPEEHPETSDKSETANNTSQQDSLPSWDQYPDDKNEDDQPDSNQEYQELASDLDDDPFLKVDQELAEQLDQELEAAFATDLDIEPPREVKTDNTISSFGAADTPMSEIQLEQPTQPSNDEISAPADDAEQNLHSDFFDELSELAEQSLEEGLEENQKESSEKSSEPKTETSFENTDELQQTGEQQVELIDDQVERSELKTELNTQSAETEVEASHQTKPEEQRFTDDDTENFKQKTETSRNLTQAFTAELPEEDENELDESWALDMMMKELDGAEDLSQPSKIEQVLDGRTMEDSSPLEEILNDRPAPNLNEETDPQEVELNGLDLSSELEDALSMDSIDSGHLSLAEDSEFNLEKSAPHNGQEPTEPEEVLAAETEHSYNETNDEEIEPDLEPQSDTPIIPLEEPSKAEMIDSIEPEPLEMEFRQEKPNWNWLWGTGAALALIAAIAQFAWIKFDDLNRQPPYRDYYQVACNILSCSLPPQIDLSKLKASNLVVRSHPETEQALVVDMVLLNLAQFEQEFPDIQLTFSDIQGKALASRVFRPSEYLAGELAGASRMPIQRPIHLSLDIVDPGNEAVNYKVDVR